MTAEIHDNLFAISSESNSLNNDILSIDPALESNSSLLSSEIVFIDETVKNYQSLVTGFAGFVFTLDSNLDGIGQISNVLSEHQNISGVHVISNGNVGSLQLGKTELNSSKLEQYQDSLINWSDSLSEDADFLFYGCNTADGEIGEEFVDSLSDLISVDIAASNDLTGNILLGGDWDLEYATGEIETEVISSNHYQDVLDSSVSLDNGTLTYSNSEAVDLAIASDGTNLTIEEDGSEIYSTLLTNITSEIQISTGDGDDTISLSNLDFDSAIAFSIDGEGGTDTVNFTGDINTFGGSLIVSGETINVASGVTVSTRQVDVSDNSTANSGNISFTGQDITLASNASVLARVEDGSSYTAGTIDFIASNTGSSEDAGAGIYLEDSAVLKGGAVTLDVDADSSNTYDGVNEDDSVLDEIEELFDGYLNTGDDFLDSTSLVYGHARANAESTIDIGANSQIAASSLTLDTDAAASAEVDAFSRQLGISAAYGESNPTAKVNIATGVQIDTTGDLTLSSHADSTLGLAASATSFGKVKGNSSYFFGATVTQADIDSTVNIATGSILNVGGNLDVDATTNKDHSTSLDLLGLTSKGGYALGINVALGDVDAQVLLDGDAEVVGNISLDAEIATTANEVGSKVVVGEPDSLISKYVLKSEEKLLSKIPGLGKKDSETGQRALTGSVVYVNQDNNAEARIGDGATVKSGGTLDVLAQVEEVPEFASASKAKIESGGVDGSTTGATIATSVADIKNTAKAYIGDNAVVDAADAMTVKSTVTMPFDPDVTEYFDLNFDGSVGDNITETAELLDNISNHVKKDLGVSVLFSSWTKAKAAGDSSYAGSVNYFDLDNVSQAYIDENAQINQDMAYRSGNQTVAVDAYTDAFTLHFAGNFSPVSDLMSVLGNSFKILKGKSDYSTLFGDGDVSDLGIGAGVVYANTDNKVKATIADGVILYSDALDVNAELDNTEISIGATGSIVGSAKKATNISLSAIDKVNEVTAHISDLAAIDSSGTIAVNALDNSNTYNFTGGFATGTNQGIGVAATFDIIDRTTEAVLGSKIEKLSFSAIDDVNIDDDSIAVAQRLASGETASHNLSTGDALVYNNLGDTSIGNLAQETVYYAIVVDENTIQLATSQSNALAGTAQDLSSIGTGFDHELIVLNSLVFDPSGGDSDTEAIFNPTEGVEGYEFIEPAGETIVVDAIDVSTISNDTITLSSHGLSDGDIVTYYNLANNFSDVESDEEFTIENIGVLEHESTYKVIYIDDDSFQLAAVDDSSDTPLDLSHSGVDEDLNYHYFTRDTLDLDDDIFVYVEHGFTTGDAVVYSNDGDTSIGVDNSDGELVDGQIYYVIEVDEHRLQLAETATDAANGTAIDLTSTGDGINHSLRTPVINTDTNEINILGHGWETGERIVYDNNGETSVGSLTNGDSYYVIAIDSDTIKLASNYASAIAYTDTNDTAIAITSNGSGEEHSFTKAIINLETDAITLNSHELSTGDALIYGNGDNTSISSSSGELTPGATYYAIVIDENTIQLAASETDANNSVALDLTATGTGEEHQFFEKITVSLTQGTVNGGDTVTVNSENSGVVLGGAIAGTYSSGSVEYASDPFEGGSGIKDYSLNAQGGLSVSGSAVVNYIDDKARAYIEGVDLYVPDNAVNITALNDNEIYAIGGAVAIAASLGTTNTQSSTGIAGSFELNFVESETEAYTANSAIDSGSLNITATNENYLLAIAAGGSGSFADSGVAFAGTLTVNDVVNDTSAYIGGYSQVNTSGDTVVTATDESSILSVAGALQLSGQYGIGASIGLNFTENTTLAYIEDGDVSATNLSLSADNSNTIHAFAAAAGASLNGMAAEFSTTYNTTNNTTEAYIDNGSDELETNLSGDLSLSAIDDSEIFSLAGVLGLSLLTGETDNYAATIGISIAINEIENETKARIKNGLVVVEGDLELIADSTSDIQAYSVAGSGSASWSSTGLVLSGAGAGTRNDVNNTIEASIENADVDITGTATLAATDNSTILADAGGAAISLAIAGDSWSTSAAISVGAGIANNEISNTVTAFISDAAVEADSNLTVSAISNATIDAFALGAAVSGTYSSSGIGISLAGAGAGTENKITNTISAYIDNGSDVTTNNSGEIALTAQDNSKVTADAGGYALALKFGNGIANGSASVGVSMADNDIENTVEAYISDAVVTSAAGIDVTATATGTIDLFSIGAAASGSIGSSGLNVALSGAGTGVENKIDNTIQAFIESDSTVESKNNGAINLTATDDSTVVADAGGFAVAVAIGSGFSGGVTAGIATAENIISNTVRAYIDNSKVTADGDLTLDATATSTIDNLTMAGAVSVAASDSAALSAAGAGTSSINEVNNTIEAYIENDSDIDSNSSISLNAEDDSTIESVAVGGSISISGSTGASFSLAIAAVEVENTINNTVRAYIGDIGNDNTTIDAAGDLNLTANSTLTFEDNYAIAASFAASVAPASASFSGAGANVTTETTNTVEAVIRNLNSTDAIQADNVTLTATDTPTIKPTVGSGALAASFVGASVSVSLTDTTIDNSVNAYIDNSEVITTSDVTLTATSTPTIESEAVTTSVAAAIGGAGAGGEVSVTISSDVASYISSNAVVDGEDVTVEATQTPTITADVFGVAVSSVAAVGASVTDIEFKGTTKAYVKNSDVITTGNLDITATSTPSLDGEVTAVAAGITTAGAGNGVTVKDNSTTEAYASNSSDLDIGSTLNITATAQPELTGDALGVSAAAGVQAGYSEVIVTVAPEINAYIGSNVDVDASDLNLTAQTLLPDTGISAEADASASGGALYGSVNAANAKAINNASTAIDINSNAELNITNTATLQTSLNSSQDAYADGYNGGILALGFNFAEANSDTTNQINFANSAEVNAGSLIVSVDGTEDNYAEGVAGGGGIVSGRAAEATTDSVSDTQVNINGDITVDTLDIQAEHNAEFNSKSDSVNASVVGGSGAYTENTVTADITVNFKGNTDVSAADDFDVTVNNNIEQAGLNDQNAEAASGGLADGSAVETITTVNNSSVINVNDGAVLAVGDEDYDTVDNLDFTILNDVNVTSKSKLANGGAIARAKAEAEVTNNTNEAIINIENADITSTHDINFSTRSLVDIETEAKASAWGLSGVSKGESLVEATVDNEINLNDGASVIAEQDANFYAGENSSGATNDISLDATTDLWNKSGSPMEKSDIDADSNLTLNNTIYIHDDAELATSENINLITNDSDSTYDVNAEGEGTDLYSQVASTLGSLVGADVSSVITNDSTSTSFSNGIDIDGSLIAGQNNQQYLYITGSEGNYSYEMSDQIESEPTVTTEDITASIDETISALETELSQYENSSSDGDAARVLTLSAEIEFWENEKAKIGDGNIEVISLPNISASVGSINIAGGYLTGTGNIEARGDAEIDIVNSTEAYLRVNDVNISDNYGGEFFFNNVAISSDSDLDNNNFNSIVAGSDLGDPEINILNDSDSILEIKGSIINRNGLASLKNTSGSIYVTDGEISAKSIDIESGESFFLSDGYLFSVDSSPEALWNDEVRDFIEDAEEDLIYDNDIAYETTGNAGIEDATSNQSTVTSKLSEAENPDGGISAESSIFLAAEYINISGNLSSGVSEYDLTIDSDIDSTIAEFETAYNNSNNKNNIDFSSEYDLTNYLSNASGTNISGYYNPSSGSIVIEELEIQGGYIQLVGNILSTGNGNIEVMDGFGDISIDNNSSYDLELNTLDTGGEGTEGKIIIIDNGSGTPVTTTYTKDDSGIVKTVDGEEVTSDTDIYAPQEAHPYNWYYQKEQTITLTPLIGSASIFAQTAVNSNQSFIPSDYQIYGDSLYFITDTKDGWHDTQDEAEIYGGNLVAINNAAENAWINDTFSSYGELWIGYSDSTDSGIDSSEGNFIWINGDTSTYTNWNSGEPNNQGNEDFTEIYPDSGLWNDTENNDDNQYGIVEIPIDELEFAVGNIDTTYETQDPEVYVYEPPSYSYTSDELEGFEAFLVAFANYLDNIFNFTEAVDYPSYKGFIYGQSDLEIDEDNNLITVDVASHYVNAVPHQYDIDINFFGSDTATVDVDSANNIWLAGDITNLAGDVNLTSDSGSIAATSEIEIETNNLTLDADGSIGDSDIAIGTNLDGGTVDATATGDIYLKETTGDITVDEVTTSGNVNIEAYGNLEADSSSAKITGEEINLTSETGNIGSDSQTLKIDSGSSDTAGVTLDAAGDIDVKETSGDLYLVSADSNDGDVSISVNNGNLIDRNPEETEDLAARAELLDTTWSEMELTDEDISTTDTDETGAASALAAEAVTAYEQSKESEYQLYWQYRNLTQVTDDDGNVSYTFDEYNAEYEFSFEETETTQLEELGYSDSAISELADNKTEQYHSLHEELAASALTDDYDPDYTYTATAEESAEISEGAVWTVDELTRVVNPSLLLPISDTEIDIEADNIQAANLTLDVDGGIGINEGNITITVRDGDGNILGISDEDLLYLLSAESKDITYLDDSDNEVADFTNNVDSIYSIAIAQIDDLDFEATGELDVTATADAYLGSEGDITINDLDVGNNEIRLKSGNGIIGTDNSTHITADNIVIEAGDNSIGSSTNPIEINTNTITARGNNDIYINQASGDLDIEQIYSGDNVDLTVVGKVSDANDTDDENIRSTDIAIDSSNNSSLGSSDNYLDVYVESGGSYEIDTSQDAYILNTYGTGIINIDLTGTTGTLSYSSETYIITDDSSGTSVNFIGFDTINLNFASQDNNFTVESLASEATLNIVGDSGNDSIELSNDLEGTVTIDGGTGTNTLILNDSDDTAANSYNINETEITGFLTETLSYSNIENIDLQSGSNSNDALTVINETDTTRTITADNTSITDSSFPDISHSDIETIDYYAESGSNDLDLTSFTDTGINLTVYSNLGDNENTLDIDAPGNHASIAVAVDENATNLKVADINHSSNSFALSGTDAAQFEILNDNELHFIATPDFETQSSYELTVIANGTDEINLTISITDINETPSLSLDNSNLSIAEDTDTSSGIKIGDITITDDALGEETLSLSGDDAELFEIVNETELYLVAGTELDYETNPDLDVTITADDGIFSVDLDITVNLTDVNEAASVDFDFVNVADNEVLVLDGDGDYVETNSDVGNLTSADFTIEAWIQTSETNQGILGKDNGDDSWENGEKAFYVNSSGNVEFIGRGNGKINSNSTVNDGKWHHVMVVWDATNEQGYIYIDGIEDTATDNYSINQEDNDGDTLKLGLAYTDDYFAGKLDKIIVWNKALSYEEIQSNLASGVAGDEENIVAFYDFEDENFNYYNTLVDNAYLESDRTILTIAENTDTTSRVKIADINISDDALGTNNLTLAGDDSSLFELDGTELYISAGVTLDYETNPILDVDIEVDDNTIGNTPDDTVNLRVVVSDSNDAPIITAEFTEDSIPEDTDTTESIKIADISITDVDSIDTEYTVSLVGNDADLFELDDTELYLVAGTTLDYETHPNLEVSIRVDDPSLGDTFDSSLGIIVPVTNTNEIFELDYSDTNQALSLDGDDDYADSNAEVIDLTRSNFTLEAWIKTTDGEQGIITKNDGDTSWEQRERAFQINSDGKLEFRGFFNGTIAGATVVNDGEWHHVAVVWDHDEGDGYIYLDGVDDTASDSYRTVRNDGNGYTLKIGFPRWSNRYFTGEIDEVRIWDKALTASEISDNFNRTTNFVAAAEDNLVAYYTFQTGVADSETVTDESQSNYNLTLVNEPTINIATDLNIANSNGAIILPENSADDASVKIADITITDNNYTTSDLILTGDDADKFVINGTELLLSAGTSLDFEAGTELEVNIAFDSDTVEAAEEIVVRAIDTLELINTVTELDENTDTTERIQLAELDISEAALSSNDITLSGDDAEYFEVEDFVLYLKADTNLDFETQDTYNVTVTIDDTVGSTYDTAVDFALTVNNLNEAPTAINLTTVQTRHALSLTDPLFFSGNENYIETNAGILDFSNDFTLETWIQTTKNRQGIINKNNNDTSLETGEKYFYINNGKLRFYSYGDGLIYGKTKVNDGKLHHVSLVWDSVEGKGYIYVDGVLDASKNFGTLTNDNSSDTVIIGAPIYYGLTNYFEGFLGDIRFWDVARTQSEIAADLSTTLTGAETGLVAYYNNFDLDYNNATITLTDVTGNYDGTLIGYDATLAKVALTENLDTTNSIKLAEFSLADEDASNTNQVTITGNYSDIFQLVTTGERSYELYLAADTILDYETDLEIEINIEVSDSELDDEAIIVKTFTVVVVNENEAPSLTAETSITELDENNPTDERIEIAELDIIDEDDNDTLNILALSGDDAEDFELDNNKLYLQAGTTLDYESKTQFDVTVELDDSTFGTGIDDSADFSITINDVNEVPNLEATVDENIITNTLFLDGGRSDDGDYVEIDSDLIDLGTDYTFEAWIKTSTKNRGIFIKDDDSMNLERGFKSLLIDSSGKLTYITRDSYFVTVEGDTVVTDGEWHHVALVLDSDNNTVYIYLDGNLEAQETSGLIDPADNEGDIIRLGTWSNTVFFDGEMRDVRFWNTVRSQTEIQGNSNSQLTGTESGLVAHYDFTDASDTQAIDRTANGIDGTLIDDASKAETLIIAEDIDTGSGVKIADFVVSDEDTASEFLNNNLSLSGTDSEFVEIVGTEIYLKADTNLDYDTKAKYEFTLELDDGTYSNSVDFEIAISNVNEAPSLSIESVTTSLSEDTDTSSRIKVANVFINDDSEAQDITLTGDDADKFQVVDTSDDFYNFDLEADYDSDTPNFSIENIGTSFTTDTSSAIKIADLIIADGSGITGFTLSGDDENSFEIVNDSELYLQAGVTIYSDTSFDLTVEATDGIDTETASLSVSLSELDAEVRELYLKANETLDYETNPQLDVTIETSDGEYSDTASYSLALTDVDEAPIFTLENIVESLEENTDTTGGYKVADLDISDDDANDNTITISGDDADKFEVIKDSELYLVDGTTLDYETQTEYNITVTVSDTSHSTAIDYNLQVTNQIENPVTITYENAIADGDKSNSVDAVIAESRDTSEKIKIADIVITGGEGNEAFTLTGSNADDYEVDGNEIYLKAGTDLAKYGDGEAFAEFTVNVDGSDSSEIFNLRIITPELGIGYIFYEYDEEFDEYYEERVLLESGNSFSFPTSVDVASESTQYDLSFASFGFDTLEIENISITGTHSDDFTLVEVLSFPFTIESDTVQFFTFEFDPSSGGELSAVLEVTSNDGEENPYIINLTGTGIGSEINLTQGETDYSNGDSQDFGIVEIDTEIGQQTFTITNTGTEALSISDVVISGDNADEFTTSFSVSEIAAGESADLTVNFTPTAGGDKSATLTINNNDDDESTFAINLTGNGAIAEIDLLQDDTSLPSGTTQNFGSVNIDNGEIQQSFTIQNTGSKALNIGDISVTGTNASYFILENSSAIALTQLEAGDSVDLTITFNPPTAETANATLTINSDDSDESAYTINFTGTGTESSNLSGSDNDDNIDNDDENRNVDAGGGDDTVTGNNNSENLRGGDGDDQIYGEDGNDRSYGDAGDDVIVGGAGRDFLRGGADNDLIFGGSDADYLIGDAGDDYLDGEEDNDRFRGGAGSDTFVLTSGNGTDLILDFKVNEDHFELTNLSVSDLTFEDSGSFGLIKFGDEILARVRNITAQDLTNYFSSNL